MPQEKHASYGDDKPSAPTPAAKSEPKVEKAKVQTKAPMPKHLAELHFKEASTASEGIKQGAIAEALTVAMPEHAVLMAKAEKDHNLRLAKAAEETGGTIDPAPYIAAAKGTA